MGLFQRKSPQEKFSADVAAAARKLLGARVVDRPEEFALDLYFGDSAQPVVMYLKNIFYEAEQVAGADRDHRIRTAVLAMERSERAQTWAEARLLLRPILRTTSTLDMMRHSLQIDDELKRRPVASPVLPHLWEMLALDSEHAMSFVNEDDLRAWEVTAEQARAQAVANLGGADLEYQRQGSCLVVTGPDGYASSWLLFPERLAATARALGPGAVVIAPSRDEVVLIDADDPALAGLVDAACQTLLEHPRSLSAAPYVVTADGLFPWEPPVGHAAAIAVARAHAILAMTEYSALKARLDELHERTGEDLFVGNHVLQEREDRTVWSWASWAPEVRGLMPRATYVAFVEEGSRPYLVPWDDVLERAGHYLVAAEGFDPPLWRYDGWPDPDTLGSLRAAAVPEP